ncbi:MAG: FeoA family protein [Bacilli bacterium]|nr:FeoA family protein [Bacilli bacterium]
MEERNTLNTLSAFQKAKIKKIENKGSIRRRLLDIGLIPGTEVTNVLQSPAGELSAYLIRGALIAIREEDAKEILIGGIC